MPFKCRGLCDNEEFFSKKRLSYSEGSRCSVCGVWVRKLKHIPVDFHIQATNEGNKDRYYDVAGKQVDIQVLLPVKQMAWRTRDEKGEFLKMINVIETEVKCPCCNAQCRGMPLTNTKYNEAKEKTVHKIGKVGIDIFGKPKIEPINSEVELVKSDLPYSLKLARDHARDHPELYRLGRPKHGTEIKTNEEIEKEQIDQIVNMIEISKGHIQEFTLEDVTPHLRDKVKKRFEKKNAKRQTSNVT